MTRYVLYVDNVDRDRVFEILGRGIPLPQRDYDIWAIFRLDLTSEEVLLIRLTCPTVWVFEPPTPYHER